MLKLVFGISFLLLLGCTSKTIAPRIESVKPLVETVPNVDLNCKPRKLKECKTEEGARCEFLKYNGEGIKRLKYNKDSPRHTFIAEMNGGGQCETYFVSKECRIQPGTTCDQEEREILFGK